MACPTCAHPVTRLSVDHCWCPNCGTLVSLRLKGRTAHEAPKLVRRCREFQAAAPADWFPHWRQLGIADTIHRPGERL